MRWLLAGAVGLLLGAGLARGQYYYYVSVPYLFWGAPGPTIDGVIEPAEWDICVSWDVSDTAGHNGFRDPPGTCIAYAVHNFREFFLAMRVYKDTNLADSCEVFYGIDDDGSWSWPPTDTIEGLNRISNQGIWLTRWCLRDSASPWYDAGRSDFAFSVQEGYITLEWKVPICNTQNPVFDSGPQFIGTCVGGCYFGHTGGLFSYYDQGDPGGILAWWPQNASGQDDPSGYGEVILTAEGAVGETGASGPGLLLARAVNERVDISLSLEKASDVRLCLYDPAGRLSEHMFSGHLAPGKHEFLSSRKEGGIYILVAKVGGERLTRKIAVK